MATNERRRSFTCDKDMWEAVQEFAWVNFDGNVSMALRWMIKQGLGKKVKIK